MKLWPFNSVDKLSKSGLLEGYVDWHSHILPGVDDGIRTMDESLATLDAFEAQGVRKVWLTPHAVSYTHLRAHETPEHLVCRLLLEKKKK